ncbi:hypothetical protein AWB78_06604 [Caballeronia calidae]|uniref:Uncharacterized protein n=1 Tax=Caballeronia calidae TaxID=1777139 RepID=A0A158EAR1_9BURK|nr:hypothetical protein [Caballeronia calidae]SAL03496.1 hypothetical protein AWB78_06604 [Caballeronia calidae]
MTQVSDITYKGYILTATALPERDIYTGMLAVRAPSGTQSYSGILGEFPSAIGAVRYAFAYGMATIDCRPAPGDE